MEIYDSSCTEEARTQSSTPTRERVAPGVVAITQDPAAGYWKFCAIVLGVAFLIALFAHAGPSSASARPIQFSSDGAFPESTHPIYQEAILSVGGFDALDGEPMLILVNESGERVGMMAMPAKSE